MALMIDAYKEQDVATFDVPGVCLHNLLPGNKYILMVLRNGFVDIICEVNLDYRKHVIHLKNGKKTLYLKVLRVIYGYIKSALYWYNIFSTTLKYKRFDINPYDRHVANKIIHNKNIPLVRR